MKKLELRIKDIDLYHQMKRGDWPSVLWMNETTIKALKEQLPEVSGSRLMVKFERFSGVPVKVDNAIKDFCFETDVQRNERLLTDAKNIWSRSFGFQLPKTTNFVIFDNDIP